MILKFSARNLGTNLSGGNPELKIEKSNFIVCKWVIDDFTIFVNSLEKDLRTALIYSINRKYSVILEL